MGMYTHTHTHTCGAAHTHKQAANSFSTLPDKLLDGCCYCVNLHTDRHTRTQSSIAQRLGSVTFPDEWGSLFFTEATRTKTKVDEWWKISDYSAADAGPFEFVSDVLRNFTFQPKDKNRYIKIAISLIEYYTSSHLNLIAFFLLIQ